MNRKGDQASDGAGVIPDFLEDVDAIVYATLGALLFLCSVVWVFWKISFCSHTPTLVGGITVALVVAVPVNRDAVRRRLGPITKGLPGAWATSTFLVLPADFLSLVS